MIIKRFRYTRESMDLKQKELTSLFDVTSSTISGWETGKDTMPLSQLIKYANKYNCSLDYLFGLKEQNEFYKPLEIDLPLIGKNLRIIRKQHNKTQTKIATSINTTFLFNLSLIYKNFSIDKIFGRKKTSKKLLVFLML